MFSTGKPGPQTRRVVLLLHGFPTSSHMFRNLIPALADRYHVIAPDYPGYGESAAPDHKTVRLHVRPLRRHRRWLWAARRQELCGLPDGLRCTGRLPAGAQASRTCDGADRAERQRLRGGARRHSGIRSRPIGRTGRRRIAPRSAFLVAPETTKFQYTDGVSDVSRIDPDNWGHDQPLLDRPGNKDIQLDLFHDYGSNVPLYPKFQAFFRERKPPTLIVWGRTTRYFPPTARALSARFARCRTASHRHRTFRARRQSRRHDPLDQGFPVPQTHVAVIRRRIGSTPRAC